MKKLMKKKQKGFTLVEVIVVLVILAIMAAILIPSLIGYIDKAREQEVTTQTRMIVTAVKAELGTGYGAGTGITTYTFDNSTAEKTTVSGTTCTIAKKALMKLDIPKTITEFNAVTTYSKPDNNKVNVVIENGYIKKLGYTDGEGRTCVYDGDNGTFTLA